MTILSLMHLVKIFNSLYLHVHTLPGCSKILSKIHKDIKGLQHLPFKGSSQDQRAFKKLCLLRILGRSFSLRIL